MEYKRNRPSRGATIKPIAEDMLPSEERLEAFRSGLLSWFEQHGRPYPWRNRSATTYEKIIAEVLLQRTQAGSVARFFRGFVRRFPSWAVLSTATEEELGEYLKAIGLWRRRAASIRLLAGEMAGRRGRFPRTREEVQALPGVGQYIANSILLFCHREAQPLLDVNMARVLERYFQPRKLADIRDDPYLQALARAVVSGEDPVAMNWAILDHAALVCKQRTPLCETCPVAAGCRYFLERAGLEPPVANVGTSQAAAEQRRQAA
jgi:A/G-specific adenine glycosylase